MKLWMSAVLLACARYDVLAGMPSSVMTPLRTLLACAQEDEDLAHMMAERLAAQRNTLLDLGPRHSSLGKKKKKRRDEHDCLALQGLARSVVRFGTSPGEHTFSAEGNNTCYNAVCNPDSRGLLVQAMNHTLLGHASAEMWVLQPCSCCMHARAMVGKPVCKLCSDSSTQIAG